MKQNLPIARSQHAAIITLILAQMLSCLGCVIQPRRNAGAQRATITSENAINLNTASTEELEALPGIGKAIAERIVAHRQQYGPFRRPEHLMMVQGISDQKFRAIRSRIKTE